MTPPSKIMLPAFSWEPEPMAADPPPPRTTSLPGSGLARRVTGSPWATAVPLSRGAVVSTTPLSTSTWVEPLQLATESSM